MHEYTIVGSEEADMRVKKLSHMSPLGAALMGKKKGDTFTFGNPDRQADLHHRKKVAGSHEPAVQKKVALRMLGQVLLPFSASWLVLK